MFKKVCLHTPIKYILLLFVLTLILEFYVHSFGYSFVIPLSKLQYGFKKGRRTEHCLLMTLDLWREAVDKKKACVTLALDL